MAKKYPFINREISWLKFNTRVLQEAADTRVPVLERLRFLGIFSNNQDEFFRVRIATLRRLIELGGKVKPAINFKPKKLLNQVLAEVLQQGKLFEQIYGGIKEELARNQVCIINPNELSPAQGAFVRNYFSEKIRPALVPIMLNQVKQFPFLKDRAIYLAVKLSSRSRTHPNQYSIIEIPGDSSARFIELPDEGKKRFIILLEDVIRYNLPDVFSFFPHQKIDAHIIKVTRDAELETDNDIAHSFIEKISKSVKARQKASPVRFVYDSKIPRDLLDYIGARMKLKKGTNMIPGGSIHNFRDFMNFPLGSNRSMVCREQKPLLHPRLSAGQRWFDVLKAGDILLHYPYHSFSHFIDLLREAAIDPDVKSIRITLYRLAAHSMVVNALVNAARNGKQVIAVVEVRARFDEEVNIKWATQLQDEGIKVIYGVPGLKVHSKFCLIARSENGKQKQYANITTGNYNEITSRVYADDSLFTDDKKIANEVERVFEFFEKNYKVHHFKQLILSPHSTRKRLLKLISNEKDQAKRGKRAEIFLKMNSLVDEEMITGLYEASRAGVRIRLIVRGICALVPGVKGISENIEVISIVDKYLEHSRIFIFRNSGNRIFYLSSSDWMSRNLDYRIEVTCPVHDKKLKSELLEMMEIQWRDNVKARVIDAKQKNLHRILPGKKIRAQEEIYNYLAGE